MLGPSFHPDDACVHLDSGTENRVEAPEASQAAVTQPSYGGTHTCPAPHESPGHAAALRRAVMTVGVDVVWVLLLSCCCCFLVSVVSLVQAESGVFQETPLPAHLS